MFPEIRQTNHINLWKWLSIYILQLLFLFVLEPIESVKTAVHIVSTFHENNYKYKANILLKNLLRIIQLTNITYRYRTESQQKLLKSPFVSSITKYCIEFIFLHLSRKFKKLNNKFYHRIYNMQLIYTA